MEPSTKNLWDQSWGQINQLVGTGKNFQLIYPFMDWEWKTPAAGYIDPTAYSVVGQMPSWSTVAKYAPSATGLYDAYVNMLPTCVKVVPPPEKQQQLVQIDDQLTTAQTTLTTHQNQMKYQFAQAQNVPPGMAPPKFPEWYKSSGWEVRISADQANVARLSGIKADIVDQQNPGYSSAIADSKIPPANDLYGSYPGFAKCSINGVEGWRANYVMGESGQDWVNRLTQGGGMPLNLSLNASQASSSMQHSWAGGSGDFSNGFFSVFADGSWEELQLETSDSNLTCTINIKAFTQVPIQPDSWFHSGYLKTLAAKNDWNQPFTTQGGSHPVFGEGGVLPLMITSLVAGYQIGFNIQMDSSTFSKYEKKLSAAGGIRIGPFHIGGGYNSTTDTWKGTAKNNSFSGDSNATYPFVMGFIVSTPGLD